MTSTPPASLSRRERNKRDKRARITQAAAALFARHGYAGTTTQEVASAADVASGTVFSYAASKPELLLMVVNEQLLPLIDDGRATAERAESVEDAVLALMQPLVAVVREQPETAGPYLREVLFGDDGPHRRAALELANRIIDAITEQIAPALQELPDGWDAAESARWIFSALITEVLREVTGRGAMHPDALMRARVRVLLRGLGVSPAP